MEYPCSICGEESDKHPYDPKQAVICTKCDPKDRCVVCGAPRMRPIGHSEFCEKHFKKNQEEKKLSNRGYSPMVIDNTKVEGTQMNRSSYKRLNSRVLDDNGQTLSGDAGIKYMKERGNTYASRLKDYIR